MATKMSASPPKQAESFEPSVAAESEINEVLQQVVATLGPAAAIAYLQGQVLYYTLLAPRSNDPHRTALKAGWYADKLARYLAFGV